MARLRPSLPVLVLAAAALVAGALIAFAALKEHGTPAGSSSDATMNQKIIDRLQPYPGSRQTRKFVRESYGGYGGGLLPGQEATSHSTTIVYSMPAGAKPKQILRFYRRQLRGWKPAQEGDVFPCEVGPPVGPCFASFTKAEALVSISVDRRHKTFSLVLDHQGANSGFYSGD